MDNLPQIFLEAAHRASLIPLASEATLYAMKSFGNAALEIPVAVAIAGGLFGHGFNLLLGRWLMKLPSSPKHHAVYQKLAQLADRYGFALLAFAPLALGNFLSLAAGMLRVPLGKALPPLVIGLCAYYGRLLF